MVKLFSIKETYSSRIFDKKKLVEFRRQNVNVKENEPCFVYTSSPVKQITGYFIVKEKIRLPLRQLWDKTKEYAGITKEEFFKYFEGCIEGTAIFIKKVKEFAKALDLTALRQRFGNFNPPQSYCNIDERLLIVLNKLLDNRQSLIKDFG